MQAMDLMQLGAGLVAHGSPSRSRKPPTVIGGPQKVLMLPMLPSLIAVRDWHGEVAALHRYINGPGGVVGVVLNNATPHMHNNGGLYRLTGDTVKQVNVYGDQDELERVRVTALNLEEVV